MYLDWHRHLPLLLFEGGRCGVPGVVVAAALIGHGNVSRERVPDEADGTGFQLVHRCGLCAVTVS